MGYWVLRQFQDHMVEIKLRGKPVSHVRVVFLGKEKNMMKVRQERRKKEREWAVILRYPNPNPKVCLPYAMEE